MGCEVPEGRKERTRSSRLDFCSSNCTDGSAIYWDEDVSQRHTFAIGSPQSCFSLCRHVSGNTKDTGGCANLERHPWEALRTADITWGEPDRDEKALKSKCLGIQSLRGRVLEKGKTGS